MRPIHLVRLDKVRPAVILTREPAIPVLPRATVAPVTTTVYGIATEVPVGPANGLDAEGVVSCDNVQTVLTEDVGRLIGWLLPEQEEALTTALYAAFDLL